MTNLNNIAYVYLIGIGGIGMSALARYFKAKGMFVAGYDKTPTSLTVELEKEGMSVHFADDLALIPQEILISENKGKVLVIYTPAVPKMHEELNYFFNHEYMVMKRSAVLGQITKESQSVAVAGTHGKTTTSSMIAHVLKDSGYDCSAFLGGITTNYNTNLLLSEKSNTTVVEADEYDRSFLQLYPEVAVLTSLDADHLDIYGTADEMKSTYQQFVNQIKPSGLLIYKKGLSISPAGKCFSYSIHENADYQAENIHVEEGTFVYHVSTPRGRMENIRLGFPGSHNVENSLAAIAVAQQLKIDEEKIRKALASFKGVKRRFEIIVKTVQTVFIDDYAHHPEELNACIRSVRELYPDKKLTGIFQPHLFSRTRDFANEFARSLEKLDEIILLDIYPAREEAIPGVDSKMLLDLIQHDNKMLLSKKELTETIALRHPEVLLTLGAGDIDKLVEPIKEKLLAQQ